MRLDQYLVKKGFFRSRDRAQEAVRAGLVMVAGLVKLKPAFELNGEKVELERGDFDYVSRGALKLEGALKEFGISPKQKICLDIGVATGGFTDLLLKNAAQKVYAVDIGQGQLAPELINQEKLVFRNHVDARELQKKDFTEELDLIVIDVSFVSILQLGEALKRIADKNTDIIALIKPQFELGQRHKGVINDEKIIKKLLLKVARGFNEFGFEIRKEMLSPIKGKEGNQEYLWLLKKNS